MVTPRNGKDGLLIPLFIKSWKKFYPDIDVKIVLICNKIPDYLNQWNDNYCGDC